MSLIGCFGMLLLNYLLEIDDGAVRLSLRRLQEVDLHIIALHLPQHVEVSLLGLRVSVLDLSILGSLLGHFSSHL